MLSTTYNPKRLYTDQLVSDISEYYTGDRTYDRKALDRIAEQHLYVVTLAAHERRARDSKRQIVVDGRLVDNEDDPRPYRDVEFEFTELNHMINFMLPKVYGSRWWKDPARRAQLPRAAFFLDANGSRYWKKAPPISELRLLHLHGLIAFPSTHIERAREVMLTLMGDMREKFPRMLFHRDLVEPFDASKAERLHSDRSALENWLEYSMKGAMHLHVGGQWSGELYRLYPNPAGASFGYPRPPVGSPERRVPFGA